MTSISFDTTTGPATYYGSGPPDATVGRNGDFYQDTAAGLLYGPKTAGTWPFYTAASGGIAGGGTSSGGSGSPGAPGATGPAGVGVPAGGDTGTILAKASPSNFDTTWVSVPTVGGTSPVLFDAAISFDDPAAGFDQGATSGGGGGNGATGPTGPTGPQGTAGTTGANGDATINYRLAWTPATAYATGTIPDAIYDGSALYACTSSHTSSAAGAGGNEPGVGASWATKWAVLGDTGVAGPTGATGAAGVDGAAADGWFVSPNSWTANGTMTLRAAGVNLSTSLEPCVKVRWKENGGAYKYGMTGAVTVSGTPNTDIALIGNTDFPVGSSVTVSAVAFSRQSHPFGWPAKFNFPPTGVVGFSGTPTHTGQWRAGPGRSVRVDYQLPSNLLGTSNGATASAALPANLTAVGTNYGLVLFVINNGGQAGTGAVIASGTGVTFYTDHVPHGWNSSPVLKGVSATIEILA